jgi:branched-subunit amino acid transport protein AzlD
MGETSYLVEAVAVASIVTFSLRALPFLVKGAVLRQKVILAIKSAMPYGIVTILAIYAIVSTKFTSWQIGVGEALAISVTVILHLLRRNVLLSIFAGTIVYVLAINTPIARI